MPRLFVDCDDTLILWQKVENPDGEYMGTPYEINHWLRGDIQCFISTHPEYNLVVWSGGGRFYAERWMHECFGVDNSFEAMAKDMREPQDQDIVVDDMYGEVRPRDKRVRVLPPDGLRRCPLCT